MSCRPIPDTQYSPAQQTSAVATTRCSSTVQRLATAVLIQGQAVLASF